MAKLRGTQRLSRKRLATSVRRPTNQSASIESRFRRAAEPPKRGGHQLDSESAMNHAIAAPPSADSCSFVCLSIPGPASAPHLRPNEAARVTRLQQASNVFFRQLTATKKNPGAGTLPGLCKLLPQLVVRSGRRRGVGGWETPPGLTNIGSKISEQRISAECRS